MSFFQRKTGATRLLRKSKPNYSPIWEELSKKLGCPCLAVNGASNHVHILISLSKNVALSHVMEEVKKSSSKWMKTKGEKFRRFAWQEGYGAFSIGESNIVALKKYIAEQKEHHKKKPFETEFLEILKKYGVKHDPRYI